MVGVCVFVTTPSASLSLLYSEFHLYPVITRYHFSVSFLRSSLFRVGNLWKYTISPRCSFVLFWMCFTALSVNRHRLGSYPSAVATVSALASASKRWCVRSPTAPADVTIVHVFFHRSLVWWYSIWLTTSNGGRSSTLIAGHGVSSQNCQSSSFSCSCAHHRISSSSSGSTVSSSWILIALFIFSVRSFTLYTSILGGSLSRIGLAMNSCTHTAVPIIATRNWRIVCCTSPGTNVTNSWYANHATNANAMSRILFDTTYFFCIALINAETTTHIVVVMRISICNG